MASLGKLINSFFTASNENTLALANLNFDFAIIKYEAPKEFQLIGTNLSSRRRNEAEDGKTHKIASRLGALFKGIVPPTPNLINAYGTRASEIATSPNVNPKKSPKYGPFAEFVGIDGTSLWAAATSAKLSAGTHAPLAMHLLACMLARRWEPAIAISIWVELVDQRQRLIEATIQDEPQHFSMFLAAKHEISRDDLAGWDASARAWLQSADEAKSVEKTKLDLIARNISIDIGNGQQTYQNVVDVWKSAMEGMELLIQGIPQQLSSGAILLALSAWHLYPDLIVLGKTTKKVGFQDLLIAPGGTATIGLQYADDSHEPGMHWSLTLSHLRYYEKNVSVDARNDMSRISMKELLVVTFGSLMSSWNVPKLKEDAAAQLLLDLRQYLLTSSATVGANGYNPEWLRIIYLASQQFVDLKRADEAHCAELIAWGRRRAKDFLGGRQSKPFFGLINPCIMAALTGVDGHEAALLYFRKLADSMGHETKIYVIRYREVRKHTVFYEFATAKPHLRRSNKHELDGGSRTLEAHQRWLYLTHHNHEPGTLKLHKLSRCFCSRCDSSCPCRQGGIRLCTDACHTLAWLDCQGIRDKDKVRTSEVALMGEGCQWATHRDIILSSQIDRFIWQNPPLMLHNDFCPKFSITQPCPSLENGFERCACADPIFRNIPSGLDKICFEKVEGNPETYCLFAALKAIPSLPDNQKAQAHSEILDQMTTSNLERSMSALKHGLIVRDTLAQYFKCYDSMAPPACKHLSGTAHLQRRSDCAMYSILGQKNETDKSHLNALRALNFAQQVYEWVPSASIPLTITARSLDSVKWFQNRRILSHLEVEGNVVDNVTDVDDQETRSRFNFAQSLACIIYFESGNYDVSLDDCLPVIAVASGNSIFVASYLMSDPLFDRASTGLIQRVTGNVGMAGMSLLVTPQQKPQVRPLANNLHVVPHLNFDGNQEDNFTATSLHLRFTKWRRPYNVQSRGSIDEGLFYVESVISVHDSGKWVCDLDVHEMHFRAKPWIHTCVCQNQGDGDNTISIDSWEELLDSPDGVGIVRAKGNWPARLAALAFRYQEGFEKQTLTIPSDGNICAKCVAAQFVQTTGEEYGIVID